MPNFAPLPDPPYFAVIFTAQRTDGDHGYQAMADKMTNLAEKQPGYIGADASRNPDGFGTTISYWSDEDALLNWKEVSEHLLAQKLGRERWYSYYTMRIAKVERQYDGPSGR